MLQSRDDICRELLVDAQARCVFLVDAREHVLVALGDLSFEEAQRDVAAMHALVDDEDLSAMPSGWVGASMSAVRHSFESGGYLLVLFERLAMIGVVSVRTRGAARKLAPFVESRRHSTSGDSGSGAPSRVAAWKR